MFWRGAWQGGRVRNKFRNDPATLAAWERARHIESATRGRRRSNGDAGNGKPDGGQSS